MKKLFTILFFVLILNTLYSQTIFTNVIYMFGNGMGLKEMATPATPTLNYGKLFAKTDGHVYWINDVGTEFDLTSGSGGSTISSFGNGLSFSLGTLSLVTQMSITTDASGLKLVGDVTSPGNNKFYKTNSIGVRTWAGIKKADLDDLDPNEILFGDPASTGQVKQNDNIVVDDANDRIGIGVTTGFVGRLNFPVGTTSADGILFGDFSVFRGFYSGDAVLAIDKGAYISGPIFTNSGGAAVNYSLYRNVTNGAGAGEINLGEAAGNGGITFTTGPNNVGTFDFKFIQTDGTSTKNLIEVYLDVNEIFDIKYNGDMKLKGIDYVLPTDNGDAGEQLQTDGSGGLTWEAAGSGGGGETNTASNLGGGLANYSTKVGVDLQFNSFLATDFNLASNLISIDYTNGQKATTSAIGFLTDTDWDIFNNKVSSNIYTANGTLAGDRTVDAGGNDLALTNLNDFLISTPTYPDGILHIVDATGLVAFGDGGPSVNETFFILNDATETITMKADLGIILPPFAGGGTRMVTADNTGVLGVSGLGTGVSTFLATPSSANLRAALTDENGTGVALFNAATSPDFTTSITIGSVAVPTISSTNTLTNKRINARVTTIASSATPTPDGDASDMFTVTALAAGATFAAPTGTPTDGQKLLIRILDNGTARSLAWNAIYRAGTDVVLPTTTTLSKTMYVLFVYNGASTVWDLLSVTGGY